MSVLFSDPQEYHLGDQVVPGWPASFGRSWSQSFSLSHDVGEATLVVDVQGTQAVHNEVLVNGTNLGHLRRNSKKEYIESSLGIPRGVLRRGSNTIEIIVGFRDEHQRDLDDILFRNVRIIAGQHPGTGHSVSPFWRNIASALTAKGWTTKRLSGFRLAAVKSAWVLAMIEGGSKNPVGALAELDDLANRRKLPNKRLLVVVFKRASKQEIQPILEKYMGSRMGKQSVGSVIHLASSEFYEPKIPGWSPLKGHIGHPDFDPGVGQDIRDALREAVAPR